MPLTIESGITLGGGINILSSAGLVTDGLTLNLDAGDSASYPGSGSTWTDLAGTADNITLVNSPTYTSGTPAYFTFNGSNQYGTGSGAMYYRQPLILNQFGSASMPTLITT